VFYQPWRNAKRIMPEPCSLAGWMLVATRKRAIAKLRRKNCSNEELQEREVVLSADLETHAAQNLLVEKVRTVMASLPEGELEALECAYFEGMSDAEMAERIGQLREAVRTRIRSAVETVKKVLS
jgi:RNA polymerase sigma-70 factor (ECF subfamily)